MMWESWFYILAVVFMVIVMFFTMTPFMNTITDTVDTVGNFTHTATNTSYHNMLENVSVMWNLWPVAAVSLALIMLFYFASEESEQGRIGGV